MTKRIISFILTFILIYIGQSHQGSFSAEFDTQKACESAITDIKKTYTNVFNMSSWEVLKCFPKKEVK